jgi:hypothetical protein
LSIRLFVYFGYSESNRECLNNLGLVEHLLQLLGSSNLTGAVKVSALETLSSMCETVEQARKSLVASRGINILLTLADQTRDTTMREESISVVSTAICGGGSKLDIKTVPDSVLSGLVVSDLESGLSFLISQVAASKPWVQLHVLRLLSLLARLPSGRGKIGAGGGILALVSILSSAGAEVFGDVETLSLFVLVQLTDNTNNVRSMIECGGLTVLLDLLGSIPSSSSSSSSSTISQQQQQQQPTTGVVARLEAVRALAALSVHEIVASQLAELGALEQLLTLLTSIMSSPPPSPAAASSPGDASNSGGGDSHLVLMEQLIMALGNLASCSQVCRDRIFNSGELEDVFSLLGSSNPNLQLYTTRLVRQLASDANIRTLIGNISTLLASNIYMVPWSSHYVVT